MTKLKQNFNNQSGVISIIPLLILVAAIGIIVFLLVSSTAPFNNGLFSILFPKPSSHASSLQVITFDGLRANHPLNGQYPAGIIDWGTNIWGINRPTGLFKTANLEYNNNVKSASFKFVTSGRVVSIDALNQGGKAATVTISCPGQTNKVTTINSNQKVTIVTGWADNCSPVTIADTNGYNTTFDNLTIDDASGSLPTPTPSVVPTPTPSVTPAPSSSPSPTATPIYQLGIGYFPLNSIYNSSLAWSKAKDVAHVAFIQRHWKESLNPSNLDFYNALAQEVSKAKNNGLKIYLAFEVLSPDRSSLELPAGLVGNFSTPTVQNAYINMVSSVAAAYKPDYFILNVEVNSYKNYNPADYLAYKTLYNSAYDAVKSASNNTKISVSLAYIDIDGINCIDAGDKTIFNNYIADFQSKMDILAVSAYPLCYFNPAVIPENFLDELASFSSKPLFVAETGWMSESFTIPPSFTFPSSPQLQADYVNRLKTMADYAKNQGKTIDTINYVAIIDMETSICDAIIAMNPAMGWYCTLALIDKNGTEKAAFQTMKVWKNSL